ncbi:hypothetical protein HGJ08_003017 [Salmonella enterica]|nr:hypothetical protein [Salmonella enterica]
MNTKNRHSPASPGAVFLMGCVWQVVNAPLPPGNGATGNQLFRLAIEVYGVSLDGAKRHK